MITHGRDDARLDLLGGTIPVGFDVRVVVLAPGRDLGSEDVGGQDALVEVEDGEVELALSSGEHRRFGAGDLLVLLDGRLRARPGAPVVLVAVRRAAEPVPDGPAGSGRDEKSGRRRLNVHDDIHGPRQHHPEP
jgi:hypothetical protein